MRVHIHWKSVEEREAEFRNAKIINSADWYFLEYTNKSSEIEAVAIGLIDNPLKLMLVFNPLSFILLPMQTIVFIET